MSENDNIDFINILLVEDHILMRRGLKGLFTLDPCFNVVGEADDGSQAVQMTHQLKPDLILMDIDLPIMDGITATQIIKSEYITTRVLALSAFDNDEQVIGMLASGADGYCLKNIEWERLIAVIQVLLSGGIYLDPRIAYKVTGMLKSNFVAAESSVSESDRISNLSSRESEILKLIAQGSSNQEIAEQLYLSVGTVKSYVRMVLNKLSVNDRVQAAAKAIREGWI